MSEAYFSSSIPYFFAVFAALFGIIWKFLLTRIEVLERNQKGCPIHSITEDVSTIKNDIQWLKRFLIDEKK